MPFQSDKIFVMVCCLPNFGTSLTFNDTGQIGGFMAFSGECLEEVAMYHDSFDVCCHLHSISVLEYSVSIKYYDFRSFTDDAYDTKSDKSSFDLVY